MEFEAHGGGAMRAADEDAGAMGFVAGMAHVSQGVPSGDGGGDGPGNPAGPGDTVSPTVPGNPGNPGDPRGPSTAGKSRGTAVTFCRSWGRSTHQGVEETLHPEPEF